MEEILQSAAGHDRARREGDEADDARLRRAAFQGRQAYFIAERPRWGRICEEAGHGIEFLNGLWCARAEKAAFPARQMPRDGHRQAAWSAASSARIAAHHGTEVELSGFESLRGNESQKYIRHR